MESITIRNIIIRPVLESDTASIVEILRSTGWFGHLETGDPIETQCRVQRHIQLCISDNSHSIFVAENAFSSLVGYASVHWLPYLFLTGPEGYISELFVDTDSRGMGIGRKLLEAIRNEAKLRDCSRLMLVTSRTRESYMREFYLKEGWSERKEVANFVFNELNNGS